MVAPGAIESEIWEKRKEYKAELRKRVKPEIAEHYKTLAKFGDKIEQVIKKIPANEVAKAITDALTSAKPKYYYNVGSDAKGAAFFAKLPKRLLDWMILKRIQKLGR